MTTKKTGTKTKAAPARKTASTKTAPARKTASTKTAASSNTAPAPQPQHAPSGSRAPLILGLALAVLGFITLTPADVRASVDAALSGPVAR
ncbi:hypothetical protein [Deinococcus radiodurans]|jgi:hypothetical protein|uniref:Uncharacterized protein n=1 Tax=Deinococcus radiodurans (strain ATCC 13939 / DSM 20539 / JCM 16871 / CCUG 27074 / LMG 4051 / NBRC 15346 / NCIMB 9279 / VKM B-1422 / R1) TaxID=243230 RepID=Q9RWZ8_DEIRA|nr:hypothetical protein [Deinococcus radiodurans]AAF10097.1 hypothetical protein DR_0517 [Deinococcus radiodurans R1 = ATCC 13939 = DSM 20539]ANC72239.1 hypothetical protein A2G07_10930 [Deinococcus radiodurans R1 = ATCC 13939 = DSM 20539]QEM72466.1 hypothetical protein DXG80_12270 [Deinococcus radiodurans]QIP28695.1 hypothetical protein HAV23_05480 [Deinococcus radiodurans]QIP32602.1 hypothetical protein HAV35_11330 [Deinococcus radiodurans]